MRLKFRLQIDIGEYSANSCAFDQSGQTIAVGCDDRNVRLINSELEMNNVESVLTGHEGSVHGVGFEYSSKNLISCGDEGEFKLWS